MKIIYLAVSGIALLAWNVASAETKPVNLELRVLVDAPPPCTVNGETVLDAGIAGFGIRIENAADNSLFSIGENNWTPFAFNSLPQLKAVPVKQNGVQLAPAEFNASMTMVVDYQ